MISFEQWALEFGGAIKIEQEVPGPLMIFRAQVSQLQLKNTLYLQCAYTKSSQFNARAATVENVDYITINTGSSDNLFNLMRCLLSHPHAFPEYGNDNRISYKCPLGTFPYREEPINFNNLKLGNELEKLANHLATMAELGMLYHELGHILHGHTVWCRDKHGLAAIDEQSSSEELGLKSVDKQTLEWDADQFSIQYLFNVITNAKSVKVGERNLVEVPDSDIFGTLAVALRKMSFALYSWFRMFAPRQDPQSLEEALRRNHPPVFVRVEVCIVQLLSVLELSAGRNPEDFLPAVQMGMIEAEQAWCSMTGDKPSMIFDERSNKLGSRLVAMYKNRWKVLRPQLDLVKRVNKLPPISEEA